MIDSVRQLMENIESLSQFFGRTDKVNVQPHEDCAMLAYNYRRLRHGGLPAASFRKLHDDYKPHRPPMYAERTAYFPQILASFPDDADTDDFACMQQYEQCEIAVASAIDNMVVNGDAFSGYGCEMDGLRKIVLDIGEHCWDDPLDLSHIHSEEKCLNAFMQFKRCIDELCPRPTFVLGNADFCRAMWKAARMCGVACQDVDNHFAAHGWHRVNRRYIDDMMLIEMGKVQATGTQIIPVKGVEVGGETKYYTEVFVGSFGDGAVRLLAPRLEGDETACVQLNSYDESAQIQRREISIRFGMAVTSEDAVGMFRTVYLPKELLTCTPQEA